MNEEILMYDVSVVVPMFNSEKYIRTCIHSLQEQTLKNIEIIVVNDGSEDRSVEIVRKMMQSDSRIRLLTQNNKGVSAARNVGIRNASGKYLFFLDADDYLAPEYLKLLFDTAMINHSHMVIGGMTFVNERGQVQKKVVPGKYKRYTREEWPIRLSAAGAHMYDRTYWMEQNIFFFPGERGEDIPISLYHCAMCKRISTVAADGYYYVQHRSSAMNKLKGLQDISLPYMGLERSVRLIKKRGIKNSRAFHEIFILRVLTTFYFSLAPGSRWREMKKLCDYIIYILEKYYPGYYLNPYIQIHSFMKFPIIEKSAVYILVHLTKSRLLYLMGILLCVFVRR